MDIMNFGPEQNLLTINLNTIGTRIKFHPWVEEVILRRVFLSNSLVVTIKERKPVVIINRAGLHYVDINGVIFAKVIAGDRMDFPILTNFDGKDKQIDQAHLQVVLKKGIKLLELMEKEKIFSRSNISEINRGKNGEFTIFTSKNAFQIKIGSNHFKEKMIRLKHTLTALKREGRYRGIERIDLNYHNRVVVKFKKGYWP